jgi:hypothetical protein
MIIKEVIHPQVPLRIPCDNLLRLTKPEFVTVKKLYLIQTRLG